MEPGGAIGEIIDEVLEKNLNSEGVEWLNRLVCNSLSVSEAVFPSDSDGKNRGSFSAGQELLEDNRALHVDRICGLQDYEKYESSGDNCHTNRKVLKSKNSRDSKVNGENGLSQSKTARNSKGRNSAFEKDPVTVTPTSFILTGNDRLTAGSQLNYSLAFSNDNTNLVDLVMEKQALHKKLTQFELDFFKHHNRRVKHMKDIKVLAKEYERYLVLEKTIRSL
mmetsp:Transcript_2308/g.2658  ORF Transcript_2308/g.2658 Transcript_2308/m.2658 type:complete len:222 (-) Transcript_2308:975-1640(-)